MRENVVKRTTINPSKVFANVLKQAEQKLLLEAGAAENFDHRGLRGAERAAALSEFLNKHLPGIFGIGSGEAIDFKDNRTGELDLFIYDKLTAAPIQSSTESLLVPAEALYAVIEVKSILNQDELNKCMLSGKKVRQLLPFKRKFVAAPLKGAKEEKNYRCPYFVFAYTTNIGKDNWAQKEFDRIKIAAGTAQCELNIIDRVFVIDRGIMRPQVRQASTLENSKGVFLEFYIHLVNFLMREKSRRPTIDWAAYTARSRWLKVE
jgi:hypothetical protein